MKTETIFLPKEDGAKIALHTFVPQKDVKAVVVLSHGMGEHALRYKPFAQALCEQNIAFYAHDHRAHGHTAGKEKLGYLGDSVTFERVVKDLHETVLKAKSDFPNVKIFLFGHSFGSFVAQSFIENYASDIDGCILSGTAGPRLFLVNFAKNLAAVICKIYGDKHTSRFLNMLSFAANNKKITQPKTKSDWLSRDEAQVLLFENDEMCGAMPTASFFRELFRMLCIIHRKDMILQIPNDLPVFIFAGDADPVGDYGKTVRELFEIYVKKGIKDVTLKLYEGGRHEMLNEINREEVFADIIAWLKNRI